MEFRRYFLLGLVVLTVVGGGEAQLRRNFYQGTCPNVEWIVRQAVMRKISQTFVTVPATLRLFFHDCFVEVRSKSSHLNICGFVQCFLWLHSMNHKLRDEKSPKRIAKNRVQTLSFVCASRGGMFVTWEVGTIRLFSCNWRGLELRPC